MLTEKTVGYLGISIHALRGEGDPRIEIFIINRSEFQSTPSVGRATFVASSSFQLTLSFQSTPSVGRATQGIVQAIPELLDFNPRPPWGGRPRHMSLAVEMSGISIHALRGEGDRFSAPYPKNHRNFNPRPPWGGRHRNCLNLPKTFLRFQSTPSVGRATSPASRLDLTLTFQSTPSVGRATYVIFSKEKITANFNPRPPWGGRLKFLCDWRNRLGFQSTPSVGRATLKKMWISADDSRISIHALRGEGDVCLMLVLIKRGISIHALRGEGDNAS